VLFFQELSSFPELIYNPNVVKADNDIRRYFLDELRYSWESEAVSAVDICRRINFVRICMRISAIIYS
jgi:NAD dependent epimerase/dehydratase family enzyme